MVSIAHLTSVHQRGDTRIFLKECTSLASAGYDVNLVVADGLGDSVGAKVRIKDTGKASGRLSRMVGSAYRVFAAALKLDADIYHLHDPELLPFGLFLKLKGKRVIFDAHEDLPQQILSKAYLPSALRGPIAGISGELQNWICKRLDCVVGATPVISSKFRTKGILSCDINNFPILGELQQTDRKKKKRKEVCYIGGLSAVRGIRQIVSALALTETGVRLNLAGSFAEKDLEQELTATETWERVNAYGFLDRAGVRTVLENSIAGLVTLLPTQAYRDSLPVKMFEYMSAGIPVIASDFPLWRDIIAGNDCGLLVDPENPRAIAEAIDRLVKDPQMAARMGANGSQAVTEKYNWGIEEKKLLGLYEDLIGPPQEAARSAA